LYSNKEVDDDIKAE
jgi:hypothetical protein